MGRNGGGSGEGGTVALGWVLALFFVFGGDRKERCRRRKGSQEVQFRQGGDWSMWDPLALLTGHFWSLKYLWLLPSGCESN